MQTSRRHLLCFAGAAATLSFPTFAFGQNGEMQKRFVFIILRGGMDGLAAVPAIGDPAYAGARGRLAADASLRLDETFALHPRLTKMHALYGQGELLPIHACATAYRERSHFDAQNVLETGAASPFARDAGWLNAALAALSPAQSTGRAELGLALAAQAPLSLRGAAAVATWSPSPLPDADEDTLARLMYLYRRTDAPLAAALEGARAANVLAGEAGLRAEGRRGANAGAAIAAVAAQFLTRPDGPLAAVIEINGWDTHAQQGFAQGALARNLTALDDGLDALKTALGPAWRDTIVLIATEFGRTVAPNGAAGTDHGTGGAAFLVGGAVRGGRVLSDWPGLRANALLDGRDLRPTIDLRAVMKGALRDHFGVSDAALNGAVFPGSAGVRAMNDLLRA